MSIAKAYLKKYPGTVKFSISQGGSDIGIGDVARKRVSIGASSRDLQSGDPGGLVFNKIARDGVCVVTNPDNPIDQPVPAAGAGHLLRQGPPLGRRPGREGHRADRPRRPHAGLRYAGRVPQHLHGPVAERRAERLAEGDQRPRPDRGRRRPATRSATSTSSSPRARTPSRTRASPATCATPSRASTRACVTSGSSRLVSPRARSRSSSTSRARLPSRAASSRRTTCRTSSGRLVV